MVEPGRRERHILSGIAIQVVVVALLVFLYSQAARHRNYQRGLYLQMKEQVAMAKQEMTVKGQPDPSGAQAQVVEMQRALPSVDQLPEWAEAVVQLARDRFGFQEPEAKVGTLERIVLHVIGKSSLEIPLYVVELKGRASTRGVVGLLAAFRQPDIRILSPLDLLEMKTAEGDLTVPVAVRLRWLVATSPAKEWLAPRTFGSPGSIGSALGSRVEPFLSPWTFAGAVRYPQEVSDRLRLEGIVWDPAAPTCVINGQVLRPGDLVDGYRLVLLTPSAALLQGPDRGEIFLSLS